MRLDLKFTENNMEFKLDFGQIQDLTDGGYERGYAAGYQKGEDDGIRKGYADGLAVRNYEVWTFTLTDGSVIEKDVALL